MWGHLQSSSNPTLGSAGLCPGTLGWHCVASSTRRKLDLRMWISFVMIQIVEETARGGWSNHGHEGQARQDLTSILPARTWVMLLQERAHPRNLFQGLVKTAQLHRADGKTTGGICVGLSLLCSLLHSSGESRESQGMSGRAPADGPAGGSDLQSQKKQSSSVSRKHVLLKGTLEISNKFGICPAAHGCLCGMYRNKFKAFGLKPPFVLSCQSTGSKGVSFPRHWESGSENFMLKFGLAGKWKMLTKTWSFAQLPPRNQPGTVHSSQTSQQGITQRAEPWISPKQSPGLPQTSSSSATPTCLSLAPSKHLSPQNLPAVFRQMSQEQREGGGSWASHLVGSHGSFLSNARNDRNPTEMLLSHVYSCKLQT